MAALQVALALGAHGRHQSEYVRLDALETSGSARCASIAASSRSGTESSQTHCWREMDSNLFSRQTEVAAAADQLVVGPLVLGERRQRGPHKRKRVGEAARAEQGETVDGCVDARKAVHRAESQWLARLFDRRLELARPQQPPSERRSPEREVRVDLERRCQLDQRLLVAPRVAVAQAENHPGPRLRRVEGNGILGMPLSLLIAVSTIRAPGEEGRPT